MAGALANHRQGCKRLKMHLGATEQAQHCKVDLSVAIMARRGLSDLTHGRLQSACSRLKGGRREAGPAAGLGQQVSLPVSHPADALGQVRPEIGKMAAQLVVSPEFDPVRAFALLIATGPEGAQPPRTHRPPQLYRLLRILLLLLEESSLFTIGRYRCRTRRPSSIRPPLSDYRRWLIHASPTAEMMIDWNGCRYVRWQL